MKFKSFKVAKFQGFNVSKESRELRSVGVLAMNLVRIFEYRRITTNSGP